MSKSVNKVILLGNIGQQPETRQLSGKGTLLTTASLATSDRFKQGEEWQERTEWHTVLFYGRLAEIARDYLRKGAKVYVEGRIRTDSWDDKETGQKRWRTQVVANELVLLSSNENRQPTPPDEALAANNYGYGTASQPYTAPAIDDNDIPF
jgi:single-strand DNA-binding protein